MTGRPDIRLLLADIDGTMLTDDKVLTEEAKEATRALRRAGIALAITSSRPPRGLKMLIQPLGLDNAIAGFNGGMLVRPDLSVIESHPLDPVTAQATVSLMLEQGVDVWLYTMSDWFLRDRAAPRVAREEWILKFDAIPVASFSDASLTQAMKIVGVSDDYDRVAACETAAQTVLGRQASAVRSQRYFLDVTHPQANKGAVATTLAERLGIRPEAIATIGDMPNDVLMFHKSGLSIAMGNASDAVKAEASCVTESNGNEGFAKAVRRFILGSNVS
jgi:Cof subfamily protein (haloacid dehalogenase superfamily)